MVFLWTDMTDRQTEKQTDRHWGSYREVTIPKSFSVHGKQRLIGYNYIHV